MIYRGHTQLTPAYYELQTVLFTVEVADDLTHLLGRLEYVTVSSILTL